MKIKHLAKGLIKKIPGVDYFLHNLLRPSSGGGKTPSARYCYSVWIRHLVQAWDKGITALPQKVVEFGPGRTLGIGILSLMAGADQYYALDSIKFTNAETNLLIFEELINILKQQEPIPDDSEFPNLKPKLKNYDFPAHILTPELLNFMLDESRLLKIRNSIKDIDNPPSQDNLIVYLAPWFNTTLIKPNSIDLILSQSVLEYMDDLNEIYNLMHQWLKPKGLISHQIDLKSLGFADTWYGHWAYSDIEWNIIRTKRVYNINREPSSTYLNLLKKHHFTPVNIIQGTSTDTIPRDKLATRFRNFTDEDLSTSNLFVQAVKEA